MSNFTVLHIGLLFKICLGIKRPSCVSWTWIRLVSMATVSTSPQVTRKGHLTSWSTRERPFKSYPLLLRLQGRIRGETLSNTHSRTAGQNCFLCLSQFFVQLPRSRAIHKDAARKWQCYMFRDTPFAYPSPHAQAEEDPSCHPGASDIGLAVLCRQRYEQWLRHFM